MPEILLLAVRTADGEWKYNPSRMREVLAGMVLIFLAAPDATRVLCEQLEGVMISVPTSGG